MIIDTNILIYLSKFQLDPDKVFLRNFVPAISVITRIEALGYPFKEQEERKILSELCAQLKLVPLTGPIAESTIQLRQKYRIKLPDAIIYATASVTGCALLTNNITDFIRLDNSVELINPFDLV